MSFSNGTEYYVKSMNGIKTFDDGNGSIIEDGTITTSALSTNQIDVTGTLTCPSVITDFIASNTNLTFNSPASTLFDFSVLTKLASENSTKSASTAYVTTAITNLRTGTITWGGTQNFQSSNISVVTKGSADNSTFCASTAYVTTAIANVLNGASYTGSQNFTGATLTATTQSNLINNTTVATTAFANTAVQNLLSAANTWSQAQDFTAAVLTAFTQVASDISNKVATTNFVSSALTTLKAGATWTGAQNFTGSTITATTKVVGTSTNDVATCAFVLANAGTSSLLSGTNTWTGVSNTFNNVVYAPTQTVGTNTTAVATCAFVLANASSAILSATNVFTGVSNTFNNVVKFGPSTGPQISINPSTITSTNTSDTIGFGSNITTGNIEIGKALSGGSVIINDNFRFIINTGTSTLHFRTLAVSDLFTIASNLTTGILTLGNVTSTGQGGTTNIGTGAKCNINIGDGTNNSTATYNGCCRINKLQVGAVGASTTGIRGFYAGQAGSGVGSGSVSFGFTFPAIPIVTATIVGGGANFYSVQISSISTTGFNYAKYFGNPQGPATVEVFNWIAVCVG